MQYEFEREQRHEQYEKGREYVLSDAARELYYAELSAPISVEQDHSLRLKVLDQCGMACTFCHNEGTPVSSDNLRRQPGDFTSSGTSDRVSIYLGTNGADFVSGTVQPDRSLDSALMSLCNSVSFDEIHLTGGEPTLHPNLAGVVSSMTERGYAVKVTSNGEQFYRIAPKLKEAGLSKVVFSIFGTTPEDLAAIQGEKFKNLKFAELKLRALERSIIAANENGIPAAANIVLPDITHLERVAGVIERYGDICKIRVLNSLDQGRQSYEAVYELLASLGAKPTGVNITAGASGMSVDYELPDGKQVGFKQIRRSYLPEACDTCMLKDNGCDEGYYGVRMYVDRSNQYRVGVCIQRMDLTRPIDAFLRSNYPEAIRQHRASEYDIIMKTANHQNEHPDQLHKIV